MKALPCPSCGAPIAVKQGVASQKCSFCENVFQTDFATVPEFEGLDEKQYKKLKRRANDSLDRNLINKAYLQFSSLAPRFLPLRELLLLKKTTLLAN